MITITCDGCKKEEEWVVQTCDDCLEKEQTDNILSAVQEVFENPIWKDEGHFTDFKSEEYKEASLRGVKLGIEHALFWICDYFGLIEEFEKLAGWKDDKGE